MTTSKLAQRRVLMRRLWNEGDSSHADIAAATGLPVDTVAKWLAEQPGYPEIISPRMVTCAVCGLEFSVWGRGMHKHCSRMCRMEARRRSYWRSTARRRGAPLDEIPPRKQWRGKPMSESDGRIRREAGAEARECGTTRDAVLAEWKFEPERKAA